MSLPLSAMDALTREHTAFKGWDDFCKADE